MIFGTIGLILFLGILLALFAIAAAGEEEVSIPFVKTTLKICAILSIVGILLGAFLPSKNTLYLMKAAQLETYENIEVAGESTKEIFSYIIDSLKEQDLSK